ncbi:MAG: DUF2029 domain-containing protein [Rhodobacterales bacterium]|nr:DUF2029 domain-containing protein [Rhodobacterales bacterium]
MDLQAAYDLWFWLQELAFVGVILVLWRWWRPLGWVLPAALAVWSALMWGVVYGHLMGQVNCIILLLVVGALWQEHENRSWVAGPLLAAACMFKMSPALFVLYWLIQRRWQAVAWTLGSAVVLSMLTLPLVGAAHQMYFYTQVLPGFGNGDYNGLIVKVGMFANHSVPNVLDQLFPGVDNRMGGVAGALGSAFSLTGLVALGAAFRTPTSDTWRIAAQVSAVGVLALLIPVYTYEHHLVWALPALAVTTAAIFERRIHVGWAGVLLLCAVAFAWPLPHLKELAWGSFRDAAIPRLMLQELKFLALFSLLGPTIWLGAQPPTESSSSSPNV